MQVSIGTILSTISYRDFDVMEDAASWFAIRFISVWPYLRCIW